MRDLIYASCNLRNHEIGIIVACDGGDDVSFVDAGVHEGALVEADTAHDATVKVTSEVLERIGGAVND